MRQRQQEAARAETGELHRKASVWYWENGFPEDAISHALAGGDFDWAAELIEQSAESIFMQSEVITFLNRVNELPNDVRVRKPRLIAYKLLALMLSGQPFDTHLKDFRLILQRDEDLLAIPEVNMVPAILATLEGDARKSLKLSQSVFNHLPQDRQFLRSILAWNLATVSIASGDVNRSTAGLEMALSLAQPTDNVMLAIMSLCHLAEVSIWAGRLHQAHDTYQKAVNLVSGLGKSKPPVLGLAYIGLAELNREWNELEVAEQYAINGLDVVGNWSAIGVVEGQIVLGRIKQAQGDIHGADEAMNKARQAAAAYSITDLDDLIVRAHQARIWISRGDLARAAGWADDFGFGATDEPDTGQEMVFVRRDPYPVYEVECLTLARLEIARGNPGRALALLNHLSQQARHLGRDGSLIEIFILKALAIRQEQKIERALPQLEQALKKAEPENYVNLFTSEGAAMREMLTCLLEKNTRPVYVSRLLDCLEKGKKLNRRPDIPPETLSGRELQILRLLNSHLSSTEIASQLSISVNTVRSHIKSIYGKLDVHGRSEAVERSKTLNLL